ncbi:hypothetical protein KY290_010806 [Solanum tuberosum]|uniref:Uncharacterized protein n=1 Tax=Solanum tuberosum TaxID=4113 RepID=A0ABQ7W0Y7_SOLTU|nr:hypothetical protein KY290_010806 [Solanum tuberosum]
MVGFACEKRVNIILVDGGCGINILPIRTMRELGISTTDLSESRLMIQGFNHGGQRAIGAVKIDLPIEELQSNVWLHVIDAKTSYKIFLVDNNPFTEAEAHFADAKFYLKKYATKIDDIASKDDELLNKKSKSKKDDEHSLKLQENALGGMTFPVKRIDMMKSSPKSLEKFVAPKSLQNEALLTRQTDEGLDPNAYRLLAKVGYNPTEPSKLGKLPLEPATRQQREGLGYKQPPPIRISIKRASNNYITTKDESATSNKKSSVFD